MDVKAKQPHVIQSGVGGTCWHSPRRPCSTPPSSSTSSSRAEPSSSSISCRTKLALTLSSTQCTSSSLSLTSSSWFTTKKNNSRSCRKFECVFFQGFVPWVILYRSYTSHPEVWSQFHPRSVILFLCEALLNAHALFTIRSRCTRSDPSVWNCFQELWLPLESIVTGAKKRWRAGAKQAERQLAIGSNWQSRNQPSSKRWQSIAIGIGRSEEEKLSASSPILNHQPLNTKRNHHCHLCIVKVLKGNYFAHSKPLRGCGLQTDSSRGNPLRRRMFSKLQAAIIGWLCTLLKIKTTLMLEPTILVRKNNLIMETFCNL